MASLIEGVFSCAVANKPISAGHTKTSAYVDENRKLDARFGVKGFREFVETNASDPTVQLQSIRAVLAVIAYRMWNFRAMDVSRVFSRSVPLKLDTYAKPPDGSRSSNIARKLLKPLYGLSTACKDWCERIRDFLAKERV